MWEGVEDRTELQHIDLPSPSGHSRVSFSFSWTAQPGPGSPASLGHVLIPASSHQLVSKLIWSPTDRLPVFTELYNSSIAHSISLEWHVWLSSSGNNCHVVHRSLSSMAVAWDFTLSHIVNQARLRLLSLASGSSLWIGMFGRVEGQYTTYLSISLSPLRSHCGRNKCSIIRR